MHRYRAGVADLDRTGRPTREQHLGAIATDGAALAAAVCTGPADARVRACPDWDLAALGRHMGFVHRWAALAASTGAPPDTSLIEPAPDNSVELAAWIERGATDLVATLEGLDPDAPTWHPFPVPRTVAVWPRRQAQETSVHRWDAQDAVDAAEPIDELLAADGVGEYVEVMLPRMLERGAVSLPDRSGRVELRVERGPSWWVEAADGVLVSSSSAGDPPAHDPDVVLTGGAEDLLLVLWGRRDPEVLVVDGDAALAAAWLALGGN